MDPYIEACGLWEDFHHDLIAAIKVDLAARVPSHYLVRTGERAYVALVEPERGRQERQSLGSRFTPDCAQGAFHDYWISLGGGDDTKRPEGAITDPGKLCGAYAFPRPCWYRFFWERKQSANVVDERDVLRLCNGVEGRQRAGCIGGASLLLARVRDPADHAQVCGQLSGTDALNCLRGVNVPVLAGDRYEQLRLIRACKDHPASTRNGCYAWFGRTLNVVTDGKFEVGGCRRLGTPRGRAACVAGARKLQRRSQPRAAAADDYRIKASDRQRHRNPTLSVSTTRHSRRARRW